MGSWDRLRELFSSKEPLRAHFDDPFIQIDRALASDRLKLDERGKGQGSIDLPPQSQVALDNVETEIITFVNEHYSRAQIDAANNVRTYDARLSGLTLLSGISSIRSEASRALGDFNVQVKNALNRLANTRDAITSSYEELREFRRENDLRRPAHPPSPFVATYGTIFIVWLLETAMNAFLLKQNDSMGYLGGVVAAATVGAINVLGAVYAGRQIWPRTHLKNTSKRVLAWVGVGVWLVLMVFWNVMAAYFRDAKSAGLEHPEQAAIQLIGHGLDSIYSYGLLVAGIIFAFSAASAAYKMDDPYPGYGGVTKRHNERCEDYAAEVEAATEELTATRNDAIEEATAVRRELERQLAERTQIESARATYLKRFEEFTSQVENLGNNLLQQYRTANQTARSLPPPAHFSDRWTVARLEFPPAPEFSLSDADIKSAEDALDMAVAQVARAFDETIELFEPLDVLKQRLNHG